MASGAEHLFKAVLKTLDLDPEQIKKSVSEVVGSVREVDERLTRIETKLNLLLDAGGLNGDGRSVVSGATGAAGSLGTGSGANGSGNRGSGGED